eukprot:CAMPEP_0169158228 /NCGR_PEP_ID=MMETSP1015-20121227/55084_1 /TAXON_ID=342587 /ORGANISM="Karlodinium micrum, Strain CCMP2283" /LENGTH=165 /DNA_ID=CAMNT_0009229373 /DNA_START=53 /DNA_END=547 /DNA_ORIENTATION=+
MTSIINDNQLHSKKTRLPVTAKGLFKVICNSVFPQKSSAQVDELFSKRGEHIKRTQKLYSESAIGDNLEHVHGAVSEKDAKEIEAIIVKSRKELEEKFAKLRKSRAGMVTEFRSDDICLQHARTYLPPGGTLQKDTTLHWRWIGDVKRMHKKDKGFVTKSYDAPG